MPAFPRKDLMNPSVIETHHLWSRCTGRAFLMGKDPFTGHDCSRRRDLAVSLIEYLASVFAVEVGTYHILSNHMHEVLRNRPDIAATWSDEEVCWRWKMAWPTLRDGRWTREPTDSEIHAMLARASQDSTLISRWRKNLANLSWYQARLKQVIAWWSNRDGPIERRGHHWEARFGNRRLETEEEVLTAFLYSDLQQVRAGIADSVAESRHSGIERQIEAFAESSFQRMYGRAATEDDLDQQELEDLKQVAANCYLAPITDAGQRIGDTSGPVEPQELVHPAGYRHRATAGESKSPPPNADPAPNRPPPPTSDHAHKSQRERRNPRRSQSIHDRMKRRQRRRASRSAVLAVAFDTYRDILDRLTDQIHRSTRGSRRPSSDRARLAGGMASPTDTATSWRHGVRRFAGWLHQQASGLPQQLAELLGSPRGDPVPAN